MLKKLSTRLLQKDSLPDDLSYEDAREILESGSHAAYEKLAAHDAVKPEMLYYLAQHGPTETRKCVAANPNTPYQADHFLAQDDDDDVRAELALKISRLVPDMPQGEAHKLRDQTIDILDRLAEDHLPRIRQIVADEIKNCDNVPRAIILKLAQDVDTIVAAPILEYSPLLNSDDLLEIIASGAASGKLEAIAKRRSVDSPVSDAIVATLDVSAVAALLVNPNAQIREDTLDGIIAGAEDIDAWHEPLVMRPELSGRAAKRVAGFVASSLLHILAERNDLPRDIVLDIQSRVNSRIKTEPVEDEEANADLERVRADISQAFHAKQLTDEYVSDLAVQGDRLRVIYALSALTQRSPSLVTNMLSSKQGKAITALVWLAGLGMRTSLQIQRHIARIPPQDLLMARDGVDYPLSEDEMTWHLSYFTE